jgi:hypothetical protein
MNSSAVPAWADTSCLLCGAPPPVGHHSGCPGADPATVHYLIETLPDGARRSWTMAGARYTATKARRAAITALMPAMDWHQAGRKVSLPFSVGALINEIVPRLGVQRWLARFGFHPLATVRVPDCGCTDVLRCRCDLDGHPHAQAVPDLWAEAALLVLRLRRPAGWLDLWLLDLGTAVVIVAEDDRGNDPIPTDASVDCQMGWCDLCPGTRPVGDAPTAQPCTHTCHTATATAGGAQPGTEGRG